MQVSEANDIKIYNLSCGKSLPEWLSERKRRRLLKKDVELSRRIELIQDFDMPGVSTDVKVTKNGQYIFATGTYKPRIKCFEVNNLSLKFERCFDAEAVAFEILSDDYSKLAILQCDRYLEFHAAYGKFFKIRVPRYGRDMQFHRHSCDMYIAGVSSEIFRLNLERGQFLTPYQSSASEINKCAINPVHQLLTCGTREGTVEAFDPRNGNKVGSLDCALRCMNEINNLEGFPSVTALEFNGGFQLGVGTATGQVMLYDIRADKPYYIKDHMYGNPIRDIRYHTQQDLVYSLDKSVLKIWERNSGKLYTSITAANTEFNNLCILPDTGLLFMANENTKIQSYYIPSLGPAPKWASFLDSLTEELEETNADTAYDDYKFITKQELQNLELENLIGTNLLRAYMHGYFIHIKLYKKALAIKDPFDYDKYKKKKIRELMDKERSIKTELQKLPNVNRELAHECMTEDRTKKEKSDLLIDDRFKSLFADLNYQIDFNSDACKLVNPVGKKINIETQKPAHTTEESEESEEEDDDDDIIYDHEEEKEEEEVEEEEDEEEKYQSQTSYKKTKTTRKEIKTPAFEKLRGLKKNLDKVPLGDRISMENADTNRVSGNKEMVFRNEKRNKNHEEMKKHRQERKKIVRPVHSMKRKR